MKKKKTNMEIHPYIFYFEQTYCDFCSSEYSFIHVRDAIICRLVQYSHREIPISPARLGDTFCCLGDFLSFHRDSQYSQRDAQVTQRDVVTVHRA